MGITVFTFFNYFINSLQSCLCYDKSLIKKGITMKNIKFLIASLLALTLVACVTDKHALLTNPQKIVDAVAAKYPSEKNTLVFIEAPDGFVAPSIANSAVENGVDNADVVAINSALALKTTTVVVAGDNESLTASTLAQALKIGKDKINGGKAIVVGVKESQKTLADLAAASGVALEFIDNI
jgi:hypothetical protein